MRPPLKALHPLKNLKLARIERLTTEMIAGSLLPGGRDCLKVPPDGTILDGHHRIHVLRCRGIDVDSLPREIIEKNED